MKITLIERTDIKPALFGIGLSYGITSGKTLGDIFPHPFDSEADRELEKRLVKIASNLGKKGFGEDKFLRQIGYIWDVTAPRFWWSEADTYKLATVAQSESTMHTIMHRELVQEDFEAPIPEPYLEHLNSIIKEYRETQDKSDFLRLKNELPEGFLQRRIWSMNLANMKNIVKQRMHHRLPQWKIVCKAFIEETPDFLLTIYDNQIKGQFNGNY